MDQCSHRESIKRPIFPPYVQGRAGDHSPEFKAWFKKSAVSGESGNPRVVYHGTGEREIQNTLRSIEQKMRGGS